MVQCIWQVLLGYVLAVALTKVTTGGFSLRHSCFLLVGSLLAVWGASFHAAQDVYWQLFFALFLAGASILLPRAYFADITPIQHLDAYLAFCVAVENLAILLLLLLGEIVNDWLFVLCGAAVLFLCGLPILLTWGFYIAEKGCPHADAVAAVLHTNPSEALAYVRDALGAKAAAVLAAAVAAAVLLARLAMGVRLVPLEPATLGSLVFFILCSLGLLYRTRENVLTGPVYDAKTYLKGQEEFRKKRAERKQAMEEIASSMEWRAPGVYVIVIGESATRDHFGAYGYGRDTTPWLSSVLQDENLCLFSKAYTCFPTTDQALSYALTAKNQYNEKPLETAPSLLEVVRAAGGHTAWLSNQARFGAYEAPVTVIADEAEQQVWTNSYSDLSRMAFYDEILADRLKGIEIQDRMVIVVHLMGSHNSYINRYPSTFKRFSGGARRMDEYDNSILYTDAVLKKLWETAQTLPNFRAMVYLSDHGEGIDEGRMHSATDFSWGMVRIPFFAFFSPSFSKEKPEIFKQVFRAKDKVFTIDLLFNFMLGLIGIRPEGLYEPENDCTAASYDTNEERFRTLLGKKSVAEDLVH